jgi:hypothetical protein
MKLRLVKMMGSGEGALEGTLHRVPVCTTDKYELVAGEFTYAAEKSNDTTMSAARHIIDIVIITKNYFEIKSATNSSSNIGNF